MACSNCRSISHAGDGCLYEPIATLPKSMAGAHAVSLIEQGKTFEVKPDDEFYQFLVVKEAHTRSF